MAVKPCEQITHQNGESRNSRPLGFDKGVGQLSGERRLFSQMVLYHSMTTCKKRTSTLLSKLGILSLETGHRSS